MTIPIRPHLLAELRAAAAVAPRAYQSMWSSSVVYGASRSTMRQWQTSLRCFHISHRLTQREPQVPQTPPPPAFTTSPPDAAQSPFPSASPEPNLRRRRRRLNILYAAIFLFIGTSLGSGVRSYINPAPPPEPNSKEDLAAIADIQSAASKLPIIKTLSSDPAWTSWDAYSDFPPEAKRKRITTSGTLASSAGLPFQRIFHNATTGELINVVYFGSATTGWPRVVHGGAIATVVDETLGRCAIRRFPTGTGVTANLQLQYRRPTMAEAFYVIRTRPDDGEGRKNTDRKMFVKGTMETLKGDICVEVTGLFVVPKGYPLKTIGQRF